MRGSLLACWLLLWVAGTASAQVASARLMGVVRDATGAPLAGAVVTVTAERTGVKETVTTTGEGIYVAPNLAPGEYRVGVEAPGFRSSVHERVLLQTGETTRLDMALQPGGTTETVTVTADLPVLRTESASLGQVIGSQQISRLPLAGRTFISLAALAPGVALPPASLLPRINGGRPRTNEYLFDGISVLQPEPGQVAFFPVMDAIEEFRIESNSPPAEFGRFNGGVVNLTTKVGTNAVQGTVFEFFRNEQLNARNYFARNVSFTPKFRRNQFGGVVGGPIARNRTFFFGDYQGLRQTIGRTITSNVPTVLQRQGIFTEPVAGRVATIYDPQTTQGSGSTATRTPFPNNTIPQDRFDAVARALLERYPLPTSPGTANNYRRTGDEVNAQDQADVRLDHRLAGGRDGLFGRLSWFHDEFLPVTPLPDGSGTTTGTLGPQDTTAWSFASRYQRVLSNRMVNELRVGDTRRRVDRSATMAGGSILPTYQISGFQQLGSPANTASTFGTSVTEIADTLTWMRGAHLIKAGFDWRWERLNVLQPPSPAGLYTFSTLFTDLPGSAGTGFPLASFLLGQVNTFAIDLQPDEIRNRAHIQEYFVQDDWKAGDRTTVNLGLRYTLNFPSIETRDQVAVFNLETQHLDYLGKNGLPRAARELHWLNFGPRLGISQLLGRKTVVRAGYGQVWIEMAGITTPFTTPSFPFLQSVTQRTLDNITPAFVLASGTRVDPIPLTPDAGLGQGVFAVDRVLGSGYVQQWNVSAQRALWRGASLEVAYAGSNITNVGVPDANSNQLTVDQLAQGSTLTQRVPNPFFGQIPRSSSLGDPTITVAQLQKPYPRFTAVSLYRNNTGTTRYHGVTMKLEQRLDRGLSYLVSYTRSRLVDDASSVFDASILTGPVLNAPVADAFDRRRDRDLSTGDIPHVFVANALWQLPIGQDRRFQPGGWIGALARDWSVSAIVTLQSGVPVAVTQVTNFNAFAGFGTQRPNLVGDPELPSSERTPAGWFNTSAFAVAPQFTLGSASRNPVRGPSYTSVDLAIARRLPVASRSALEIRIEIFNLFDTPPFAAPAAVLGAAGFGSITSAGDPRVAQLAARFLF